jgi:hypothetical protein
MTRKLSLLSSAAIATVSLAAAPLVVLATIPSSSAEAGAPPPIVRHQVSAPAVPADAAVAVVWTEHAPEALIARTIADVRVITGYQQLRVA